MDAPVISPALQRARRRRDAAAAAVSRAELPAIGIGVLLLGVYVAAVLSSDRIDRQDFLGLFGRYLEGAFALWLVLGLGALVHLLWQKRPRGGEGASPLEILRDWMARRWRNDRLAGLLWPPLLFGTLMAAFNAFKQMILPQAGFRYDPLFAEADRMLFGGQDGWAFFRAIADTPQVTHWLDLGYHGWFAPMSIGLLLCAFGGPDSFRLRTRYLLSYMLVWIGMGTVLAWYLPAAGPCFYERFVGPSPEFAAMMQALRADDARLALDGSGVGALRIMGHLDTSFGTHMLTVGAGISAMPSVHNGLAVLFALASWQVDRRLGAVMALYAFMIWVGSVYLGWHYAIDGIAAALLTWLIWIFSGRMADRLARRGAL